MSLKNLTINETGYLTVLAVFLTVYSSASRTYARNTCSPTTEGKCVPHSSGRFCYKTVDININAQEYDIFHGMTRSRFGTLPLIQLSDIQKQRNWTSQSKSIGQQMY